MFCALASSSASAASAACALSVRPEGAEGAVIDRLFAERALPLSDLVLARPPFTEEVEEFGVGDLVEGLEVVGEAGFVDILRPKAPDAGSFSFVVDMVREECSCNVVWGLTVEDGRLEVIAGRYRDSYIWRQDDIRSWLCADMYEYTGYVLLASEAK